MVLKAGSSDSPTALSSKERGSETFELLDNWTFQFLDYWGCIVFATRSKKVGIEKDGYSFESGNIIGKWCHVYVYLCIYSFVITTLLMS